MIIQSGQERIERYWSLGLDRRSDLRRQPYSELVAAVANALEESVRLQLVSDVPLGAFLSGGVDSSLLAAMMAQMVNHQVKTFSVGFEAEGTDIDESQDAKRTAHFLGTDHTHVLVKGTEVHDRLQHIAASLDQPSVDGVNAYFVSLAARQAVTVAISGTGGDELFAGYPWFISMVLEQRQRSQQTFWQSIAGALLAAIAGQSVFDPLLLRRGGGKLYRARIRAGFVTRYATLYAVNIFGPVGAARLLSPDLRRQAQAGRSVQHDLSVIDELPAGSPLERVTGLCLRGYTNNQLLRDIDAVSMAHSLEVRVPFLDPVIADVALSLPDPAKLGHLDGLPRPESSTYRDTGAKRVLIDVGRPLLPPDFDLQPKRGFSMPFAAWLRGPLHEVLLDTLSDDQVRRRGWLNVPAVAAVKRRFLEDQSGWARPWLLMMLELWSREVLDQPVTLSRNLAPMLCVGAKSGRSASLQL